MLYPLDHCNWKKKKENWVKNPNLDFFNNVVKGGVRETECVCICVYMCRYICLCIQVIYNNINSMNTNSMNIYSYITFI